MRASKRAYFTTLAIASAFDLRRGCRSTRVGPRRGYGRDDPQQNSSRCDDRLPVGCPVDRNPGDGNGGTARDPSRCVAFRSRRQQCRPRPGGCRPRRRSLARDVTARVSPSWASDRSALRQCRLKCLYIRNMSLVVLIIRLEWALWGNNTMILSRIRL